MTTPVPSVPDFLAGFGPQQSDWQSLWVNAAAFFQQRVIFRATQSGTATTLPSSGSITTITYDNILEDPYSGWSASTHRWTAPAGYSGWYQVTVTVWVTAPSSAQVVLEPYVQTTAAASNIAQGYPLTAVVTGTSAAAAEGTFYPYLTGGLDAVYGAAAIKNASASVSTDLTAGTQSSLEICWVSS